MSFSPFLRRPPAATQRASEGLGIAFFRGANLPSSVAKRLGSSPVFFKRSKFSTDEGRQGAVSFVEMPEIS